MAITNTCNSATGNISEFLPGPVTESIFTNDRYRPFVADRDTAACQDILGDLAEIGGFLERDTCWLAKRQFGVGEDSRMQDNAAVGSRRE